MPHKVSYKNVIQECPARLPHKRVPYKEGPTARVSHKSVRPQCPTRAPHKGAHSSVAQECPRRVPHKSVPQERPTREGCTSECPAQDFPTRGCPTRVAYKSVPQERPTTVSQKRVPYESVPQQFPTQDCATERPHKTVPQERALQEWPTRASCKRAPQECQTLSVCVCHTLSRGVSLIAGGREDLQSFGQRSSLQSQEADTMTPLVHPAVGCNPGWLPFVLR